MPNASIRRSFVGALVAVALGVTVWSADAQAGPSAVPTPTPTTTPTPAGTPFPTPTPIATPTATPTLTPPPLAKVQQACVNEMNKNGAKVNKAQLKENERCLKDFQRGKLDPPMTFDTCKTADLRGKVQRAKNKTFTREAKKCDPLVVPPPPFAYTDSATVNAVAVSGGRRMTDEIFGLPVLDDDLATKAGDPEAAKCQFEVLKRIGKLENTILKELIKAKKRALKDATVGTGSQLAERLADVFSSNAKIERARSALLSGVDRKCAALQVPPGEIFAGDCGEGDPDLKEVEFCAIVAAHCAACAMINAYDDLNLDCDQLDDQVANGSCEAIDVATQLTNAECFPSSIPVSASRTARICIALANAEPDMVFTPLDFQNLPEDCKPWVNPICR